MWQQLITLTALVFFLSSIVNVVLNTIKSIVTIKGSTLHAAIANAITFGFYTFIVKQMAEVDLIISIPLTMIANFIGVYVAIGVLNLFKKDRLWKISCTVPAKKNIDVEAIAKILDSKDIENKIVPYKFGNTLEIYSYSQGESVFIKEIITKEQLKYTVVEIEKSL